MARYKLSTRGKRFLIDLEGERLKPYRDKAGHPTIGVGHKILPGDVGLEGKRGITDADLWAAALKRWPQGITRDVMESILAVDLLRFEEVVSAVKTPLAEYQADAMISFAFNVGTAAFGGSTLRRKLDAGDFEAAMAQLELWCHSGRDPVTRKAVVDPILVHRRGAEARLFTTADYDALKPLD